MATQDPRAMAEGFDLVLVNGQAALESGEAAGRPGRLVRRVSPTTA